jgi:hypothetical protein
MSKCKIPNLLFTLGNPRKKETYKRNISGPGQKYKNLPD